MSEKEYLEIKRLNETLVKRIEYLENENKKLQERPTQCYSSEEIKSIIKDLIDTNKCIEEDYNLFTMNNGTLANIGCNFSYELANIGFELGYANWQFFIGGDFEKVKEEFLKMVIENEKIVGAYTEEELKEIEERIKNTIENSDN